jgi:hypothetical protein
MGLDITAYKQLAPAVDVECYSDGEPLDYHSYWRPGPSLEWSNKTFPGRCDDVDPDTIYSFADSFQFRAGSYGGYNQWRDHLARMAGYGSAKRVFDVQVAVGPFIELIDFADNEGAIGATISAKLARDFLDNAAKAAEYAATLGVEDGAWFLARYLDWQMAFEMAADHGAVDFH